MTDARFPDRWLHDKRVMRLNPVDFRSFVVSLTWSASNRTDGRIEPGDTLMIPGFSDSSIAALEAAELWCPLPGAWMIVDFDATQTSKTQLEGLDARRHADRERKARERAHKAGDHRLCLSESECHVTVPRTSAQKSTVTHRQGQDRQGIKDGVVPEDPWRDVAVAVPGAGSLR